MRLYGDANALKDILKNAAECYYSAEEMYKAKTWEAAKRYADLASMRFRVVSAYLEVYGEDSLSHVLYKGAEYGYAYMCSAEQLFKIYASTRKAMKKQYGDRAKAAIKAMDEMYHVMMALQVRLGLEER